ncbi:MAG TPA: hypothetical protein PKM41_05305 [Deltaproteobacteria bacterium]|jgi:hypothetical protein|nr:hypothetical protein [Deltaproteobacteria bacterium]HOI06168.1 hypothetical protein [Deltaproteobacteria bacterium]
MDRLTKADLQELILAQDSVLISIYMPTERTVDLTSQGPIRLKNLIKKAWEQQPASGLRAAGFRELLRPAEGLLDDSLFWQYQDEGLALFLSREGMRSWCLPIRFSEEVVVSGHFQIKPLLQLFGPDGHFFVLVLGQKGVRLLYATRFGFREVDLKGTPTSMAQALRIDEPGVHPSPPGFIGKAPSGIHGQGIGTDYKKPEIMQFFQRLSDGVHEALREENAPLVLAGEQFLLPMYEEANLYPYLVEQGIPRNPESMTDTEIHARALDILRPRFNKAQEDARMRFRWLSRIKSRLASSDLGEIVVAAHTGRVDTLFVALGVQQWGWFEPGTLRVEVLSGPATGVVDLLDAAAVWTLQNRGSVYAVEPERVPGGDKAAALFRY